MNSLSLPMVALEHEPAGPVAELEQPVHVKLPAFTYPDGGAVAADQVRRIGAFVYRRTGGIEEIWNEGAKAWQPPPADLSPLTPVMLQFKEGESPPWQGLLVAAGQKDGSGAPRFARSTGGQPRFVLRAWAHLKRGEDEFVGLGPPSAELQFVSAVDNQRFNIELEPERGREATRARLQLRDAGRKPAGWIEVRDQGGREVEIVKCDGVGNPLSSVLLADDGTIYLRPASGREIVFEGDLRARRVRYLSSATGTLEDL